MSHRTLRCYDYVNQPYQRVRETLLANPNYVFRHATAAATTHAAALHVRVGSIDIGADVVINVVSIDDGDAYGRPGTGLKLEWQAATNPHLFPFMKATLSMFALSPTETQLALEGTYELPMGKLGEAIDAAAGHKLAEASVKRFIQEVAGWLREELAMAVPAPRALA